jgi:hypothetical protein
LAPISSHKIIAKEPSTNFKHIPKYNYFHFLLKKIEEGGQNLDFGQWIRLNPMLIDVVEK